MACVRRPQATMTAMASRRRTAMVTFSTRTAIGSRPTTPSCSTFDPGAFDEAELDQAAFELRCQAARSRPSAAGDAMDHAREAAPDQSQRQLRACVVCLRHRLSFQSREDRSSAAAATSRELRAIINNASSSGRWLA